VHLNTTQCTAVLRFFNTVFFFLYIADKRPILLFQIRNLSFLHSNENLIKFSENGFTKIGRIITKV